MSIAESRVPFRLPPWRPWHGWALAAFALLAAIVIFFAVFFQWNWFRGTVERIASRDTGRTVKIDGNLHVHLWSWHPTASVDGISMSNPDWAPQGNTAVIQHIDLTTRFWPLLWGQLDLIRVNLENPTFDLFRDKQGRANWEFGTNSADNAKAMDLPAIQHFTIHNGKLTVDDKARHMLLTATLTSHENVGGDKAGFQLAGQGTLNAKPFTMNVTGGPLINVDRSKPYAFNMDVVAGSTHLTAKGAVTHPFDLGAMTAAVTFSGANLANLYYLTGLAFPSTPPYRLRADFTRDNRVYKLNNMTGTVGRSDLKGNMGVDVTSGRPFLSADLSSHELYFTDLGPLFGSAAPASVVRAGAAKAGVPMESAMQEAAHDEDAKHLLPDTPLAVDRVRQMDANVVFHADRVISTDFPLRQLNLKLTLDHGVLNANPISFALSQGKLAGKATVDARGAVPVMSMDARLQDVSLQQFVGGKDPIVEGTLEARAKLTGTGVSIHKVATHANGTFTAIVPHGTIRQKFAELLGIDIDRAFLFSGDKDTNVRCILADFQVRDGVMNARHVVFDSDVVKATGSGTVNLGDETVNMQLNGAPKKFTLIRLRAPIEVTGPWTKPSIGIKASGAIAQGGVALALGVLLTPLAAIIPFVDPGLAKNADCGAAVSTAQSHGAPHVKK
ncbi:MAG TPA: AsmA family protein [Rhizomicrobium sp.]